MLHTDRVFKVADVERAEDLAHKLTQYTWTTCTAFRHGGLLFLNDATSEDGAQEYAVVRETDGVQVESVTFGWMDEPAARTELARLLAETAPLELARLDLRRMLTHGDGYCRACA